MITTAKHNVIADMYAAIESEYDLRLSNITIKAIVDKEFNHAGWIFPGGYTTEYYDVAIRLARGFNDYLK
jgi:hypothetical protein